MSKDNNIDNALRSELRIQKSCIAYQHDTIQELWAEVELLNFELENCRQVVKKMLETQKADVDEIHDLKKNNKDMKNKKCLKCKKGIYIEMSVYDDWEGKIHCNKCGHCINRYQPSKP